MLRDPLERLRQHPATPWVGLGFLALLAVLPAQRLPGQALAFLAAESGWRDLFVFVWLSADLVLAATIVVLGQGTRLQKPAHFLASSLLCLAWTFELYDVLIQRGFYRVPDLYNDVLLLPDLYNLSVGLLPVYWPTFLLGAGALVFLFGFVVPFVLSEVSERIVRSRRLRTALIVTFCVTGLVQLERGIDSRDAAVQSSLARLGVNIADAFEVAEAYETVKPSELKAEAERRFGSLRFVDAPSVYLLVSESYGAYAYRNDEVHQRLEPTIDRWTARLGEKGLHVSSHLSTSPVVGGQSWLATTTLLTGVLVDSQRTYQAITANETYGLPAFLGQRGHTTVTTQPGTRDRPGRPASNPFGFDHTVYRDDLDYTGDPFGWGRSPVPDQFSLGFTHSTLLAPAKNPVFFYFMTRSSHLPWNDMPPVVEDYRTLQVRTRAELGLMTRLKRKVQRKLRGETATGEEYASAIQYQLDVLLGYITELGRPNTVYIIIGDHQPPMIEGLRDAQTPVHIVSDIPAITQAFEARGFRPGLVPHEAPGLRHQDIYGLTVDAICKSSCVPGSTEHARAVELGGSAK